MDKYEPIAYIGKGNFGSITKIRRKADGKILVWKELNYGVMSEKDRNRIVSEVNILRELHHPNIVKYYDRIIDKKNTKLFIVMEYCPGGDLSQLIKHNRKSQQYFSEDIIWKIFAQVASALYACHTHKDGKILHRDIKPSNIFIDQENNIKLGDFGLSLILSKDISFAVSRVGTPYYMSPEQINDVKYNEKSDIWSLGCFLYELTTLHPPFEATTHLNLAMKIKSGKVEDIPSFYSNNLHKLISMLMNLDQNVRPNIKEIVSIPEISLRIRERKIKEKLKKLKKVENDLKMREMNIREKEEELLMKEKYLNEREKNLSQREQFIKNKEEEFLKVENDRDNNRFNNKDLSITSGNFNIRCFRNINNKNNKNSNNIFMMSNSLSYKNIPVSEEKRNLYYESNNIDQNNMSNNNKNWNKTDEYFYKNPKNKKMANNKIYSSNRRNDIDNNSTFYTNYNKNDSTQNISYKTNNRNDSGRYMNANDSNSNHKISYNANNNNSELRQNYANYNPNSDIKNKNRYVGTSPNAKGNIAKYNNNPYSRRCINNNIDNDNSNINFFQSDISYGKSDRNNNYQYDNNNRFNENINQTNVKERRQNNYYRRGYNEDNRDNREYREFSNKTMNDLNSDNSINSNNYRHRRSERYNDSYKNDDRAQNYENNSRKRKENINFNNMNNNRQFNDSNNNSAFHRERQQQNDYYSERNYNKNCYNNFNINKDTSFKNNTISRITYQGQMDTFSPDKRMVNQNYNKGFYNENEDDYFERRNIGYQNNYNSIQKHNSFNNASITNKKIRNVNHRQKNSNMNTINFNY